MTRSANPWMVLAALLAGVLLGRAWAPDAPGAREEPYLVRLRAALDLSPAQVEQVEALLAEEDRAVQALVERARQDLAGPVAEHRERTQQALLDVLEPEQRARFHALAER